MNAHRIVNIIIMVVLLGQCAGCLSRQKKSKPRLIAFEQQEKADIVIDFFTWRNIAVAKPPVTDGKCLKVMSQAEFFKRLPGLTRKRNFIVVVLDKAPDPDGKSDEEVMNDVQLVLTNAGFKRVVFQQSVGDEHPDGLPILRDSAKRQR
jgi:hypothetical protein